MFIKNARCDKCGKIYDLLSDAFACSESHNEGDEYTIEVSYRPIKPIEHIECTIELPVRGKDDHMP